MAIARGSLGVVEGAARSMQFGQGLSGVVEGAARSILVD